LPRFDSVRDAGKAAFRRAVGVVPQLYTWRMRSQRFPRGSVHDADFEVFRGCRIGFAVDVGANRGQSIVSIKSVAPDAGILAFEPSGNLVAALRRVALDYSDVSVLAIGCGRDVGLSTLYVPVARGIVFEQYASLTKPDLAEVLDLVRQEGFTWCREEDLTIHVEFCAFAPLDALLGAEARRVDLLKIDVEGAELDVVHGGRELIERDRPLILAERPNDELVRILADVGYEHHRSRQGENSVFVRPQHDRGIDRASLAAMFLPAT